MLEHNVPIDFQWYLDHQLAEPLKRIFEPVVPNVAATLLSGDHTRKVYKATSEAGPMMRFARKSVMCVGCRAVLPSSAGNAALCVHCKPNETDVYCREVEKTKQLERDFALLWTGCQRCQGTPLHDVLCNNNSCPVFYRRVRVRNDLERAKETLDRFKLDW